MAARSGKPSVHEIAMEVLAAAISNPKTEERAQKTSRGIGELRGKLVKEAYLLAEALIREGEKH